MPSISTAWNTIGKQAEAITTSAVIFSRGKMRMRPVKTLVADTKSLSLPEARNASKSTKRSITSLSGLMLSGLKSYGDQKRDRVSSQALAGEPSYGTNDSSFWVTARCSSGRSPLELTARHMPARRLRVSCGPPRTSPSASVTALMAPADAPDMPSISMRGSAKRLSSTPQVKAPCAPPPCSARLIFLGEAMSRACEPRLLRGPTAVDRYVGAGDLGRRIRAEKDRQRRHLLDGDELLGGLRRQQHVVLDLLLGHVAGLHGFGNLLLDQRRPDIAGADAVGGGAERRQLERHRLGETGEPMLGGHIGGLERGGDQRMGRRRIDDAAPFARLHPRHGGADGVEGRRQIDGDDHVPFLDRELLDRRHVLDAGIVHQDIDAAQCLLRALDHADDLRRLAHVGARIDRFDPEVLLDAGPFGLDRGRVAEAVDHDVGALLGERARDGKPDP